MNDEPARLPLPPPGHFASRAEGLLSEVADGEYDRVAAAQVYALLEVATAVERLRRDLGQQ